jgi:hypothetical protein
LVAPNAFAFHRERVLSGCIEQIDRVPLGAVVVGRLYSRAGCPTVFAALSSLSVVGYSGF